MAVRGRFRAIAYGTGNLGAALFFNTIQTYLIFFYVDVVRLDARLVGLAFAISYGVWNAVNDPLVGALSDRTRTRWGRRVPWIAVGTPFALLFFVMVWSPPLGGRPLTNPASTSMLLWFAVAIGAFDLANTAAGVAYVSLFPELFPGLRERTEVSIYRQVAAMVGTALGLALMPLLASGRGGAGTLRGWSGAGLVLGLIAATSLGVSLLGAREPSAPRTRQAFSIWKAFAVTLASRSFLAYMAADLMINFIWSWLAAMVPFFSKYVVGLPEGQTSILFVGMFGSAIAMYPVWRGIALRIGSRATLALSVSLFVLFLLPVLVLRNLPQAIVMMFFVGSAHSGITLVREILLGDVIDEDELATGRRREGSYFGVCAFIERLVMVLIGGATGLVLSLSRYDPAAVEQPGSVATGIRMGMALLPLAALAIFLAAMRFYPLGKRQVLELRERLEQMRVDRG